MHCDLALSARVFTPELTEPISKFQDDRERDDSQRNASDATNAISGRAGIISLVPTDQGRVDCAFDSPSKSSAAQIGSPIVRYLAPLLDLLIC
jgi:hypothetical protein